MTLCFKLLDNLSYKMSAMIVPILADIHDLLRPEVLSLLRGCGCILHGGDVSSQKILDQLAQFAPVRAVRGNNDKEWAEELPPFLNFELGRLQVYMTQKRRICPRI